MLQDISLLVTWSTTIALETTYASLGNRPGSTRSRELEEALDRLNDDCLVQAFMLEWQYTDLPLPPGNLP
jgi:hypothetical protein